MIGVMTLQPSRRNSLDALPFWPGLPSHTMDFAMDLIEDCIGRSYAMRPRQCLAHHGRCCPQEATPIWRSPRKFHPLFGDVSFQLAPRCGVPTCTKNNQSANTNGQTNKNESCEDETRCEDGCGVREDGRGNMNAEVSKDLHKKNGNEVWQYDVDVSGCDEVRAYTQDGLLVVEGRRRGNDTSVNVRRETILPPHINPEKLKATLKRDGRLVLSTEGDTKPPLVTSIPVAKEDSTEEPRDEGIAQEKENDQEEETNANESPQEKSEAS